MNLIRIGDDTDHGGKVQTGLATMRFDGRPPCRCSPAPSSCPSRRTRTGKWVKVQPKTTAPTHGNRHSKPVFSDVGAPVWTDAGLANTTTNARMSAGYCG